MRRLAFLLLAPACALLTSTFTTTLWVGAYTFNFAGNSSGCVVNIDDVTLDLQ